MGLGPTLITSRIRAIACGGGDRAVAGGRVEVRLRRLELHRGHGVRFFGIRAGVVARPHHPDRDAGNEARSGSGTDQDLALAPHWRGLADLVGLLLGTLRPETVVVGW